MADPRFFANRGPFRLAELAEIGQAELANAADADRVIADVAPLDKATADEISFLDNRRYVDMFAESGAGACIVAPDHVDRAPPAMALLVTPRPYRAYARIAAAFYPLEAPESGVDATAHVAPGAQLGESCQIGPGAVIADGAVLGDRVLVEPTAVIGTGVTIGADSRVGAGATLAFCDIGERCQIHPGVRIGQRGFGFDMAPDGHLDVPQLGRVIIGNDVEIGANSTIDRGSGPDTVVGDGTKIDNLVQIGHNVAIGKHCVIVAQAGIAGSTQLGDFVVLAGQSGVAGHLKIAQGTQLAARSGIMRDTEPGARLAGNPAIPASEFFRHQALIAKLSRDRLKKSEE